MATNDKKRKGESRKAGYAKRKALGNERTNKAKRLIKQVRLFKSDLQALGRLQDGLGSGDIPSHLTGKANAAITAARREWLNKKEE